MATSRIQPPPPPPQSKLMDLDVTIVSAKHLKNVNWRNGDLKPYAIFWVDPERRFATKPDDCGSTRPVWNEHFSIPINTPPYDSVFTLEIFHSKPSETPKPLVGVLRFPIKDLVDSDESANSIRTLELRRPSGRPNGKIRIKLALRERPPPTPDYHIAPQSSYYYSSAPPPPPPARDYRGFSSSPYTTHPPPPAPAPSSAAPYSYGGYSDPYSGYYGYYSQQPPVPPPRPFFDRPSNYGVPGGPSAPVDYSAYEHKPKGSGKMGLGTGLAVGAVAGALGGLALEEGIKYEEEKVADRVENDLSARDDYSDYHRSEY
ncbi:hypothetical protein VitviT2T_008287 [Vitis vinifera]|uniref:C2 domain-containing protein n=2 Tax=Vitis vinifera TaxID=29760 RepID=D7SK19_VITVI|eukprot:XP_002280187.1 PREDICTED: formin-like protein 14 [Vitis vinifera]